MEGWPDPLNLGFVEDLYKDYLNDPSSVAPEWRRFFDSLARSGGSESTPVSTPSSLLDPGDGPASREGRRGGVRDAAAASRRSGMPSDESGPSGSLPAVPNVDHYRRFGRLALHAWRLSFKHPSTGKPLALESPLPEELRELIRALRRTAQ
jgi:2-oxoglutarate dehydrogenase complex dehydrogenase (E1) component-like enzyme